MNHEPPWALSGIWNKGPHVAELQLRVCFGLRAFWLVAAKSLRRACADAPPNSQVEVGQRGAAYTTARGFKIFVGSVKTKSWPLTDEMMSFAPDGSGSEILRPMTGRKGRAAESVAKLILRGAYAAAKEENIGGTDLWWPDKGELRRVQVKHDKQPGIDYCFWVQTHERNPRRIH